jgi:hypothetical protein
LEEYLMANRRFEMYQYRHILSRMRSGDSDRDLARAGVIGHRKAGEFRRLAESHSWLDPSRPLHDEAELAAVCAASRKKAAVSSQVEPFRTKVIAWVADGIDGTTIHRPLVRNHGFTGSYSAVRRFLQSLPKETTKATVILDFAPGEAAQVDFGAGPKFVHPHSGAVLSSWFFVMTLCASRHQYAELVFNQKAETWLACHRGASNGSAGCRKNVNGSSEISPGFLKAITLLLLMTYPFLLELSFDELIPTGYVICFSSLPQTPLSIITFRTGAAGYI